MAEKFRMATCIEVMMCFISKLKNLQTLPNIILVLFFIVDMLRFFKIISLTMGNEFYVIIGGIALLYTILKKGIYKQRLIIFFIIVYTFSGALGIVMNSNMDIQELLWPIAFISLGLLLLNFKISYRLTQILYYLYNILIIYSIIRAGNVNLMDLASSRNTISIIVLIYFCLYIITSYNQNKKITLIPIFIGLLTSFIAIGRSGILTFILLLLFFIGYRLLKYKSRIGDMFKKIISFKGLLIIFTILVISGLLYAVFSHYINAAIKNVQTRGADSLRTDLWVDYVTKTFTSVSYFIFGTPISGTHFLDKFNQNLHNSLLMLHAKYGIVAFSIVIALMVNGLLYFYKTGKYIFLFLFIAVLFRMQFDYTDFNAQLDIILFYFLFYPFFNRVVRSKKILLPLHKIKPQILKFLYHNNS